MEALLLTLDVAFLVLFCFAVDKTLRSGNINDMGFFAYVDKAVNIDNINTDDLNKTQKRSKHV